VVVVARGAVEAGAGSSATVSAVADEHAAASRANNVAVTSSRNTRPTLRHRRDLPDEVCEDAPMSIAIQDTYAEPAAHCYGCGRLNEVGYQIKTRLDGDTTVTEFVPSPYHTAFIDSTYGGLIASIIDCHSTGSAALFAMHAEGIEAGEGPSPRFVTAHLEVDYLAPTPLSQMHLVGRAAEIKERKVIVATELSVDGEVTAEGSVVLVRLRDE
jgi:acyl-coenzyme A thioesterase PaaI-like protein